MFCSVVEFWNKVAPFPGEGRCRVVIAAKLGAVFSAWRSDEGLEIPVHSDCMASHDGVFKVSFKLACKRLLGYQDQNALCVCNRGSDIHCIVPGVT